MPWTEQLPGGTWRACWRDVTGRKRSKSGFTRKAAAKRYAGEQESKTRRGDPMSDGRSPRWGDWCDAWFPARAIEPSTRHNDGIQVECYLRPKWGQQRLNRISRTAVQTWVNELARELSPASVERIYRIFSASMTAALHDETVPLGLNPCVGIKRPPIAPGHERYLTRGEVDAIAEQLNGAYRLSVLLAAGTGMRPGEWSGLHWQRVDLGAGLIDIIDTWDPRAGQVKPYPKGRRRRAVPIPTWLAPVLGEAADRRRVRSDCGLTHRPGAAGCRSGLVVEAPKGGALDSRNFGRRQWLEACLAAGIDPPTLKDLRHTYASWLVQAGVPLQEVQRLLGHVSILTSQRYAHLGQSQNERVLVALG